MVPEKPGEHVGYVQADNSMVATTQQSTSDQNLPFASIIVACRQADAYVLECLRECLKLDYPSFELIVLPDYEERFQEKVRMVPTGPIRPSEKRNMGVDLAKGEIVAFIDGDAYPARDWLTSAVGYFEDPQVAAVGGPGLTPESDNIMQKASGEVLSSFLGGGPLSFRHTPGTSRKCDDIPTVNLLVRKSAFKEAGGFNSSFWPGEDTKFCRDVVYGHGKEILYAPDVRVFHHRRVLFRPHLKQIAGYGFHRGYFSKKFPENSRKPVYFLPSVLAVGFPTLVLFSLLNATIKNVAILLTLAYLLVVFLVATLVGFRRRSALLAGGVFLGTVATHLCYGTYFLKGLFVREIDTRAKLQI